MFIAVMHDNDLVGHGHRLDLVMRDIDGGRLQPLVQFLNLGAHRHAQFCVEVGQRFVEQKHLRIAHDRPAHRHALALAAGELARIPVEQFGKAENPCRSADTLVDLGFRRAVQHQREGHIVGDRHMRVKRIVLEHHGDIAILGRQGVDHLVANADFAGRNVFKPGQHSQERRFPAAGRADKDDEFAILDFDVHALDDGKGSE
jgi:hypothetical protein